jgi:hypothetical protein
VRCATIQEFAHGQHAVDSEKKDMQHLMCGNGIQQSSAAMGQAVQGKEMDSLKLKRPV